MFQGEGLMGRNPNRLDSEPRVKNLLSSGGSSIHQFLREL